MKIKFYHEAFDCNENYELLGKNGLVLESTRIVCPTCNGEGSHFRTDLDENLMCDSFREDNDEDGFNAYRNGAFDQKCTQCNGNKIVDVPNFEFAPKWVEKCIQEWYEEKRYDEEVRRAECGYQY